MLRHHLMRLKVTLVMMRMRGRGSWGVLLLLMLHGSHHWIVAHHQGSVGRVRGGWDIATVPSSTISSKSVLLII